MKNILILLLFFFGCAKEQKQFTLNDKTYNMWQNFIKPTKNELAWAQIPWRSTFYDGLVDSDKYQKPLLLWVMNEHPLGCT